LSPADNREEDMKKAPADFERDVFPAELQEVAARRTVVGRAAPPSGGGPDAGKGLVGLALSGGGIRSATFCLGAIQSLAQAGFFRAFDYLSTVSGGGFVGGCVSSLLNEPAAAPDGESFPLRAATGTEEAPAVRHVRNSANYLAPGGLLDRIRFPALFLRGVLMNALALVPYLIFAALATQLYYSLELDDRFVGGVIVALAVFLFVVLLLMTKPVSHWLSWTARNRYEALLSASFLLLLILLLSPLVLSLVDAAKDLTPGSLFWKLEELATSPAVLWRVLAVIASLAALAAAAQFSRTASGLRSTVLQYALGMLGPIAVLAGYLLVCVVYLEPRWLDTIAAELRPKVAQQLEFGTVPEELAKKFPKGVADCSTRPLAAAAADGPEEFAFWRDQGARAWTSCGEYYVTFPDNRAWFEAERVKPEDMAAAVDALDNGRIPPLLHYELFQDGTAWYFFDADTRVTVRTRGREWAVPWPGGRDQEYLAITLFDGWLHIFWEQPFEPEAEPVGHAPNIQFEFKAHVHPQEKGRWKLTSAGRSFEMRELHGRIAVSWNLGWDLDHGIVSDVLRTALVDKGGLPRDAEVDPDRSPGTGRWLIRQKREDEGTGAASTEPPLAAQAKDGSGAVVEQAAAPVEIQGEADGYWTPQRPVFMGRDIDGIFVVVALFWLVFYNGLFLNVNASAFHGFYRDRLSRAYLIKRGPPGAHELVLNQDRQPLSGLNQPGTCAPYHLVNVALNLNGMTEPDMRGRRCDFFIFSKHFTGSPRTGYCGTAELERVHRHMDLGTAMAISGAAASPNAGTATLKPLVFLLTLLNVRLGYWLPHPARVSRPWWSPARLRLRLGVGSLYLWREATGEVSSRKPYVNLSDGGHIENLGIYPLLWRRCKLIVAIDGEQDPALRFGSLMQLMMFARIDLGANIYIDLDPIRASADHGGRSRAHFAVGRIAYGDGQEGWLLYVKASLTGDEGPLLDDYREAHPDFPHQSTANQFFNERQFEMYRALGHHILDDVSEQLRGQRETGVDPRARREILEALEGAPAAR
jgi:hypothetical protein